MASPETVLTKRVLAAHGARPDLRLWRNETAGAWVGKKVGTLPNGNVVLRRGARMIQAGLCTGSADLVGLLDTGRFLAIELKWGKGALRPEQRSWLDVVEGLGGVVGVARTLEEVEEIIGPPPGR